MKMWKRLTALTLALVMCLGMTVLAAGTETENDIAKIEVQTMSMGTSTVKFYADPDTGLIDDKEERIVVTYTNADAITEQGQYLILMVTGDGSTIGEDDEILYIDQVTDEDDGTVDGTIAFEVYPSQLKSGTIMITGTNITPTSGKLGLIAAIIEGKYVLGDVNEDGQITAADASLVLQYVVFLKEDHELNLQAANVNGDGTITAGDASKILRVAVKLESF